MNKKQKLRIDNWKYGAKGGGRLAVSMREMKMGMTQYTTRKKQKIRPARESGKSVKPKEGMMKEKIRTSKNRTNLREKRRREKERLKIIVSKEKPQVM